MANFLPTIPGVSTNVLDMTEAMAPFFGTFFFGLFLASLAGIVIVVLADCWSMQRQQHVGATRISELNQQRRAA